MTLRDQPYLPLYVQDFLTDEKLIECSPASTGIYIRLMCILHKSDEYGTLSLKEKDKVCQTVCYNFAKKLTKQMPYSDSEINAGLQELITEGVLQIEGDKLIQKRMVRDNEISIKRSEAGSKGGFAKAKGIAKDIANSDNEDENEIDIGFEDFWNLYDKKRGDKSKLEKKWNSLTNKERELIMQYIPKYKLAQPDKAFRKDPQTFFNNKSWNDEIIQKTAYSSKKEFIASDYTN